MEKESSNLTVNKQIVAFDGCWAKTVKDARGQDIPGLSVFHHCLNVGCVAEALIAAMPPVVRGILPFGTATLAALHDVGKLTLGFQAKSTEWLLGSGLDAVARREALLSISDHALVSQVFLQKLLKPCASGLWSVAVGSHHGRPKGRDAKLNLPESLSAWATKSREQVAVDLIHLFGALPTQPPSRRFEPAYSDLWLLAGLITVADWLGSNEEFFSPQVGVPPEESRALALRALNNIGWPGGALRLTSFSDAFAMEAGTRFEANSVQQVVADIATTPGLIIIEAPMGSGKTEAALHAAQKFIANGDRHGLYFALPTQVTSNRIHRRIATFLGQTLVNPAQLRLAHANAWLEDDFNLRLRPSHPHVEGRDGDNPNDEIREARSWFASAKQALLAPYGVGTIDQALQGIVAVKHFFVRRFALAGKVVILDEIHSYDVYTGTLVSALVRELINLGCSVIILSATLTAARRRELLEAARCPETDSPASYPLITIGSPDEPVHHISPVWTQSRQLKLRAETITEEQTIEELIARAEAGQHVLWIRNTVIEAQNSFRAIRGSLREGDLKLGLLHSRFPFQRRADLENDWLDKLGRNRAANGPGSILVATQVVEQSVDIDLDFIVSDLAPSDMLFQRMGRLWRHERPVRAAAQPDFWIRLPLIDPLSEARDLKRALGRSARVYAPYVLLRSSVIFTGRTSLTLPSDIRPLLEATYADLAADEPAGWRELREELEAEKHQLTANAAAAMRVLGLPMLDPEDDKALTRRKGPPTVSVLLLRLAVKSPVGPGVWHLTALDGSSATVSDFEWRMSSARFLHHWLVRVPRWMVPKDAPHPHWLGLHVSGEAVCACVSDDGRLVFGETPSAASYHDNLGVFAERLAIPTLQLNDDDEFDH
jgi:CRISPR-associated endonuclease/helicase Cas3